MATHFSILAWRISMDRGAWWAISVSSISFAGLLKWPVIGQLFLF